MVPFEVAHRFKARLLAVRAPREGAFNDLQRTILNGYAEFASLVVENHYSYAELLEQRNARFQALEAQIRPHFMYNVLNNLIGLNRLGDRESLESSIFALKELLRYSVDAENMVSLRQEFHIVERYCELQSLRFGDRLGYEVSLDPALSKVEVPSLIVQPLVENAIVHGIEPMEGRGTVFVRAEADKQWVVIIVEDNGVGFVPGPIRRSIHVGLFNVRERLKLAYTNGELTVDSSPGGGSRCSIRISLEEVSTCAS
jgi:two-component system sensor histidine kinase YesM